MCVVPVCVCVVCISHPIEATTKTMFELPDMDNVIKVTVDNSAVKGTSEPIVTYGKKTSTSVA